MHCILFWAVLCAGMGRDPHLAVLGVTDGWYVAGTGSSPASRAALFMTISEMQNGQHTRQHRCATTATHWVSGLLSTQMNGPFSSLFVGLLTQTTFKPLFGLAGAEYIEPFLFSFFTSRLCAWDVHAYLFSQTPCHAQKQDNMWLDPFQRDIPLNVS